MLSFTPDDLVQVTAGRYAGHTGTVSYLSMGMVRVVLDERADDVLTFYPDELALDLLAEGAQTISGLRSAIEAVAA